MAPVSELAGREIAVPASIANLGPGFDVLGVAVQLYLRVRIKEADASRRGLQFQFRGKAPDGQNYIERAFLHLAGHREVPFLRVEAETDIPMKAGLGSSAAATVAGLRLFEAVFGPQPIATLLAAATVLEGHPDNAAAALLGGLTVCCQKSDGSVSALSCPWPDQWKFVVLTPDLGLETKKARTVLPQSVTLQDAVANLQRVATIVAAAHSQNEAALVEAFHDRLHQPFRKALVPGLAKVLELKHPSILGAFLSGSGPSIAVVTRGSDSEAEKVLAETYKPLGIPFQVRGLGVHVNAPAALSARH